VILFHTYHYSFIKSLKTIGGSAAAVMSRHCGENNSVRPLGRSGFKCAERADRSATGNDWTTRERFYWLDAGLCVAFVARYERPGAAI
jgi:hypothetical protein